MNSFFHLTLRTSDVDAARAFYTSVLGDQSLHIVVLHEQAVARGARPHWLGFIDVGDDVDAAVASFTARGAQSLAPKWVNPEGIEAAVIRDPGGALIALAKPATRPAATPNVDWYQLLTQHVETAKANYAELLGWSSRHPSISASSA